MTSILGSVLAAALMAVISFNLLKIAGRYRRNRDWPYAALMAFFGTAAAVGSLITIADLLGLVEFPRPI